MNENLSMSWLKNNIPTFYPLNEEQINFIRTSKIFDLPKKMEKSRGITNISADIKRKNRNTQRVWKDDIQINALNIGKMERQNDYLSTKYVDFSNRRSFCFKFLKIRRKI